MCVRDIANGGGVCVCYGYAYQGDKLVGVAHAYPLAMILCT